jgi:hypothetical protein
MYPVDNASSVATLPAVPAAGSGGWFIDTGNGTIVPAWWCNQVQEELLAILQAAGLTPNKTQFNQIVTAILILIGGGYEVDAGTVNAIVIAPTPAPSAYAPGQRWSVKIANTTTAAATFEASPLATLNITFQGSALGVGALQAGQIYDFEYDGANIQLLTPPGGSSAWLTNGQLAQMAAGRVKANLTGSAAAPADVTLAALATALGVVTQTVTTNSLGTAVDIGGQITQRGTFTFTFTGEEFEGNIPFDFPIAFPASCDVCIVQSQDKHDASDPTTATDNDTVICYNLSLTGAEIRVDPDSGTGETLTGTHTFMFIAIGS